MQSIRKYLGLVQPLPHPEFQPNRRAGAMPVCQRCGALVAYESQQLHLSWHDSQRH